MGVKFEYTSTDTPKQNEWVERKFATLSNQVNEILNNEAAV